MIKTVLLGIALLVTGVLVYEHSCRISDDQVRAYMRTELDALRRYDSAALCEAMEVPESARWEIPVEQRRR